MPKSQKRIVIAVGGSGGHIFPAQAFVDDILASSDYEVLFAGSGLSHNPYFNKEHYPFREVAGGTPFSKKKFSSMISIFKGFFTSLKMLIRFKPDLIVGFGSYHSFPVLAAAKILKIPMALYESNAKPGKVIKLFSKRAVFTAVQVETTQNLLKGNIMHVGMPLWITKTAPISQKEARAFYGLQPNLWTILVFGGSQGSAAINETFVATLPALKEKGAFQVIHFCGKNANAEDIRMSYEAASIEVCVKIFEDKMAFAWSAADMVICRSGAGAVAEILHFGVPSILIPYPHADNHQRANALFLEKKEAAKIIEQKDLTKETLLQTILFVKHRRESMKAELGHLREKQKQSLASCVRNFLRGKE